VERDPGCREHGWLECARAELHLHQGPLDRAAGHADPTRLAALVEAAGFADVTTGTVTATYRFASLDQGGHWLPDVAPSSPP